MCGVWVALEDVGVGAGPLEYYPGSHKLPIYTHEQLGVDIRGSQKTQVMYHDFWQQLINELKLERKVFYSRKGQALIWLANLLHGGYEEIDRDKTRCSQVTHYYFKDCTYFSPVRSTPMCGSVEYRTPHNIFLDGELTNNFCLGKKIDPDIVGFQNLLLLKEHPQIPLGFNPVRYLELNPDVVRAGLNPFSHWINFGKNENLRYE